MATLEECQKTFEKLLNKNYILTLENGMKIELYFLREHFHHLMGLHKLSDLCNISNKGQAKNIYKKILKEEITHKDISKSVHYKKIKDRINHFPEICNLLHSKIIIDFNPALVANTKLKNIAFILYKRFSDNTYVHLGLSKNKEIYPATFFAEHSSRYISEQNLLEIINVEEICKNTTKKTLQSTRN